MSHVLLSFLPGARYDCDAQVSKLKKHYPDKFGSKMELYVVPVVSASPRHSESTKVSSNCDVYTPARNIG